MTTSFVNSGNLITGATIAVSPHTVGEVVTERTELFLESGKIESVSGVSITVNKPTKYGGNPVFGSADWTWDRDINYCSALKVGSTFKIWYAAVADDFSATDDVYLCYATSEDGITWSKPNLGLVTYDGDTNNNIVLDKPCFIPGLVYNPDGEASELYVMAVGGEVTDVNKIYTSADGTTWSAGQTLTKADGTNGHLMELLLLDNGTWRAYYHHIVGGRNVGYHQSINTDVTAAFRDNGGGLVGLDYVSANDQEYGFGVQLHYGNYLGFGGNFNESTDQIHLDLHYSRDGVSWEEVSDQWVPLGAGGTWDDEMLLQGKSLVHHNNDWYYFYTGFGADHATTPPREARVGLAIIGYERIGSIGTSGNLVTDPIRPAADLHVNTDASGGSLKVELLNANDDSVVDGFSQDDFDTISSDTYDTTCQWGGLGVPMGKEIKIKFILDTTTLYSYWVRA